MKNKKIGLKPTLIKAIFLKFAYLLLHLPISL